MKNRINAFTILELLVVIGIISILAVALLVALNPGEAQRRARDAQRLKDINTLQTIVEQYLNAGNTPSVCAASAPCYSSSVAGNSAQTCTNTNWTGINLCQFANTVPADPINGSSATCLNGLGTTTTGCVMRYRLIFSGSNYEISTMLEAKTNDGRTVNDGGSATNANSIYQIYSAGELTTNAFTVTGGGVGGSAN